ncbi:MAG: ABC transporter permease [Dehalococcoidia bacterium]
MSVRALPTTGEIDQGPRALSRRYRLTRLIRRRPIEAVGVVIIMVVIACALFADAIAPFGYADQNFASRLEGPSAAHPFGTDSLGRDTFSRIIHGARTSMLASTTGVIISAMIGAALGMSSGYFGGKYDLVLQRLTDSFQTIPTLLLAMIFVVALGSSLFNVALALGLAGSTTVNRVVRGSTMAVRQTPYVEAAIALGAPSQRIVMRHILPNVTAPLIVACSIQFGAFITAEAALSFLGLGVPPPLPSWGGMLSSDGRAHFMAAPWLAIFPGIAITVTVLATNLVGDALRDILDPRQRGA